MVGRCVSGGIKQERNIMEKRQEKGTAELITVEERMEEEKD